MAPKSKSDTNADGEVTPQDAKFIVECLKSIGDDKLVIHTASHSNQHLKELTPH